MIDNYYDFDRAISIIDEVIKPSYLNKIQEIILRQVWEGKTYSEIATNFNYEMEYVKTKGYELWKLLSKSFGTQISKSNFVPFMRNQLNTRTESRLLHVQSFETVVWNTIVLSDKQLHWTTAPDVSNFRGRELELVRLNTWSQNPNCRCIVVSGMLGCGKTSLVTKFAKQVSDRFEYIIWFSLTDAPSVKFLLANYLHIFDPSSNKETDINSDSLHNLLAKLIYYLRQHKCLLVLDELQAILKAGDYTASYRQGYEEYGQLLRCLLSTQHQSLLIATSCIKPKILDYYSTDRVFFLNLKGLQQSSIVKVFSKRLTANLSETEWQNLSQYCQYNPQILNIVVGSMKNLMKEDIALVLRDIFRLKEIEELLDRELNYLSLLEKEIVYLLAISCCGSTFKTLERIISNSQSHSQRLESLNSLKERHLVLQKDNLYVLQPLIKDYARRKLINLGVKN
ncbi:ATP-binding protein [Myxosarcina sp. GI1]|uniref:ATP-binding protein n=1 Tax=Myxosarcina sp. GI1 TaxID=1541065 RepID=UPI0005696AC7|nr:ATP-binding protein [Myxosarcina sp. GI1]